MLWGLLGPEKLSSERRTRTLGLGAAVREFNDLAVQVWVACGSESRFFWRPWVSRLQSA
jgi:hypothetical protein